VKLNKLKIVLVFAFFCCAAGAANHFLKPGAIDVASLLPGPPADDSAEHRQELQTLLDWQEKRTPEQIARCKAEEEVTVFAFGDVLGNWFNAKDLPLTAHLMRRASNDAKVFIDEGKTHWDRKRPWAADPRIHSCVVLENTPSYPSGHATRGILWGTLLSAIFPEEKEKLMARGELIGEDRVISGAHYPSDVVAGQKLGAEIAKGLLGDPEFQAEFEKMKHECLAEAHTGAVK